MKYYFMSFMYEKEEHTGFGNFFTSLTYLNIRSVEKELCNSYNYSAVYIINFQEISKEDYDRQ